ncbi:hypothetical protein PSPTOT1_3741 [Pseudomonas syringae pv. tomato T1]|nr:hypothetical protein XJ28_18845 [Pseudomonas syringae pv. tomato]EEB61246.1 hypothetical protein PSPTOT1_3741 [Pseudomonas syringae pv. tomato T1]QBI62627.1 hypothetical protein EIZ61_14715 [Pseudomonas syringae]KGK96163.1 hypothetical protein NB04_06765 [Pseudomonas syringae pv. tomato]TES59151.1 hypothetical protein E2N91_11175 [Pseudomonas syringae pv. tomato]
MSQTLHNASVTAVIPRIAAETARAHAVASALELISARVSSAASVHLDQEMEKLSTYADQIQAALKVK